MFCHADRLLGRRRPRSVPDEALAQRHQPLSSWVSICPQCDRLFAVRRTAFFAFENRRLASVATAGSVSVVCSLLFRFRLAQLLAHVDLTRVKPYGTMNDAVHDGIRMHTAPKAMMPIRLFELGAEYRRCAFIATFQ